MRSAIAALALGASAAAPDAAPSFSEWMIAQSKTYSSAEELRARRRIFERNVVLVEEENQKYADGEATHWLSVNNQFADMAPEEFVAYKSAGRTLPARGAPQAVNANAVLPTSVDWTTKGVVGPVVNQGQLGQDWAFAAVEVIESNTAIARGSLVALSVQQLVDCADQTNWQQYTQTKGLCTAADYPASGGQGTCKDTSCTPVGKVASWVTVPESETGLMTAVAGQTVFVAVEADQTTFQFYQGGVLTAACGSAVDHAMQLVGYGTDSGNDYWKARNSWGTSWGEKGYIRLGRGKAFGPSGQCGIQSYASYATITSA